MWKKSRNVLIMLSIGFNVAFLIVWAAHFTSGRSKNADQSMLGCPRAAVQSPLYEQLDLSKEQRRKAEPRMIAFRTASDAICKDTSRLRNEMIALIAAPRPDADAIDKKQGEIIANQKKMQELTISHILVMKRVFTPAQQKKFFILMRERAGCRIPGMMLKPE